MSDTDELDAVLKGIAPPAHQRQIAAGEQTRQKLRKLIAARNGLRPETWLSDL